MVHRNAPLIPAGRLRPARRAVEDGWPLRRAAERFQAAHTTAARWVGRYRRHGRTGMHDRSSRPHRSPRQTLPQTEERVVRMRREHRIGPLRPADRTGPAASTRHRLHRRRVPALTALERAAGEPVRHHERARPGELVHIGVKKLGRIPKGGGHMTLGRPEGGVGEDRRNGAGYAFLRTPPWTTTLGPPPPRTCPMRRPAPAPAS